jgi:hypothetical protein
MHKLSELWAEMAMWAWQAPNAGRQAPNAKRITRSPMPLTVKKVDVAAILIVLVGVILGIAQRKSLPAVPLWTPDTWGHLNPALSWLGGAGFQQTYGRDWLYPAILAATIRFGEGFSSIVRLQQCLSLLAAPLLWFGVRLWLSIFPRRSKLFHSVAVLLGAVAAFVYVLGTDQIQLELTIGPEGLLAFFIIVHFIFFLAYFRGRWVTRQPSSAIVFGGGMLLSCYTLILLKPSWSLAVIPVFCALVAGTIGAGPGTMRFAPAVVGLLLIGAAYALPHLLQFKPDLGSRTLLPFNLIEIHAGQIMENAKRHHLLGGNEESSDNTETRFYQELEKAWEEARIQPFRVHTLGFDPDYIQYHWKLFSRFQSEQNLTDDELIKLCYHAYFRVWLESPGIMVAKIAGQFYLFLTAPSKDFSAHTLSRSRFLQNATALGPYIKESLAEVTSRGYTDRPAYARYLGALQTVYSEGLEIHRLAFQRQLAIAFAKLSPWIQAAFFAALFWVIRDRRFGDLRLSGYAAALVTAGLYGNVLTISIVHTLEVERYRTSYAPGLLLSLVIMTGFLIGFCEQLFQHLKLKVDKRPQSSPGEQSDRQRPQNEKSKRQLGIEGRLSTPDAK